MRIEPAPSFPSLTQCVPCLSQKDYDSPIELRLADMTEDVKLKLEASAIFTRDKRVTIDLSATETSAELFAVKEEEKPSPLQPSNPLPTVEAAPVTNLTPGISVYTMPTLASTKPPLPAGAPPLKKAESAEAVAAAAEAGAKRAQSADEKKAKRARNKVQKKAAAAAAAEQPPPPPPPPAPPPKCHRRPPASGVATKRKADDVAGASVGRKKSVRAPPQHALMPRMRARLSHSMWLTRLAHPPLRV